MYCTSVLIKFFFLLLFNKCFIVKRWIGEDHLLQLMPTPIMIRLLNGILINLKV